MPDKAYRDSVPLTLFISAVSMVLGAFFISIVLLINLKHETLVNRQNGLVNQTYLRASNCFTAVPASDRTAEWVNICYDKAEKATGTKVERYGAEKH